MVFVTRNAEAELTESISNFVLSAVSFLLRFILVYGTATPDPYPWSSREVSHTDLAPCHGGTIMSRDISSAEPLESSKRVAFGADHHTLH